MKPLKLTPVYKDYIWGGSKLKDSYNKGTPYEITAESWEVSCRDNGMTQILDGEYGSMSLADAISLARDREEDWLGTNCSEFDVFPVLVKLIDANDSLSVQVHPDDVYAMEHENGSQGKTEVWYVVEAEPEAELVYGLCRDVTREEIRAAIERNELNPYLNCVKVKEGDVFFVRSGLIHAIGKGILVCEIQQNSDITYRVYDWGRVGVDGKPRQLHIEKALDVMCLAKEDKNDFSSKLLSHINDVREYLIADCEYFKVRKRAQEKKSVLNTDGTSFLAITFVKGNGSISSKDGDVFFEQGDSLFLPALCEEYTVCGSCEFLITSV